MAQILRLRSRVIDYDNDLHPRLLLQQTLKALQHPPLSAHRYFGANGFRHGHSQHYGLCHSHYGVECTAEPTSFGLVACALHPHLRGVRSALC